MAIWLIAVVALAIVGRGVDSRLQPTDLRVSGSSSSQARSLVDAQFGESSTIPVLLSGPSRAVRSQGKALAVRLQRERGVTVVSPWNAGPGRAALRPAANRVLMLVSISGSRAGVEREARRARDLAHAGSTGPVRAQFGGDDPLLGGPGHVDATALTAVFAVMFALSIDYQMFTVSRIREELAAGATVAAAIETGMRRTAGVVTGAALSMLAVFASFAIADVTSLRVFGIGLAVAVALDATLVRLVLLPALLRLLGRRAWWPMAGATGPQRAEPAAAPRPRPVVAPESA